MRGNGTIPGDDMITPMEIYGTDADEINDARRTSRCGCEREC